MKEFIMKHPFITFLIVDTVVCNVLNFGNNILRTITSHKIISECQVDENETEEAEENEPTGDIH